MRTRAGVLDSAGASLSGLCLAHCLALPLLSAFLPSLAQAAEAEWIHIVIVALAAPIAARALLHAGGSLSPSPAIVAVGLGGLSLLALGAFGPHATEQWANLAGGVALASAHIANWRRRHRHAELCRSEQATT